MANVAEMIEAYDTAQVLLVSAALTVRRMREADPNLLPPTMKGASLRAPQIDPRDLTNFILANGAHLPVGAADAVRVFRHLVCLKSEELIGTATSAPFKGAYSPLGPSVGETLGKFLDGDIAYCGDASQRGVMEEVIGHDWTLSLCLEGKFATISQLIDNEIHVITFGERVPADRARRIITLPYRVITIAGELWQNTRERRALIPQVLENENTDPLPGGSVPTRTP